MVRDTESRVARYYRVLKEYNGYRSVKVKKVCQLCFQPDCKHNLPIIKRSEALECLTYWSEIAKMEAKKDMLWLDDDIIVPKFPISGKYTSDVTYDVFPRLDLPLSIVHVDDVVSVFTDNKPTFIDLPRLTSKATHYGYIIDDQFWLLKSFKYGSFFNGKGKFSRVSNYPHGEHVVGFTHLMKGNVRYDEFVQTACRT